MTTESFRVQPRLAKGFRDLFAADLEARRAMIETVRAVYERYGFEPLETPAIEYVEVLGKNLPESDQPDGGIFAWKGDDDEWIATRYDLTAPLARVVAQYAQQLPRPFRRYQVGPVYRLEKPGPGRFREFTQFDFDTVGSSSMAADAEAAALLSEALEALGVARGDYVVRVNDRKVLNGVLEQSGALAAGKGLTVLRAVDKLDRLGVEGVRELLGKGRADESGDFTPGAGLAEGAIRTILDFVQAGDLDREVVLGRLADLVGESAVGREGVAELAEISALLTAEGVGFERVQFDPSVVRGLAYYTGPVLEAALTFPIVDDEGVTRPFGSVAGGGRYDDLVERFTGEKVPATGASIGVDRLLAALRTLKRGPASRPGPIVVAVLEKDRLPDYQRLVRELRDAGLAAELYLGDSGFRAQLKYADKRNAPIAVIVGGNEFASGTVALKDLALGRELASNIQDRDEWRKGQPAQVTVPRDQLVPAALEILARLRGRP
jgi:histidyl-tRNA synthetase